MTQPNPYQPPAVDETEQFLQDYGRKPKDLKWLLLSFDGRISRSEFWKGLLISWVLLIVPLMTLIAVIGTDEDWTLLPIFAIVIPWYWTQLAVQVKRWHDRNKSGFWVFIGAIPYIGGLWALIETGCLPGTPGQNRFGEDPLG